MRVFITLDAGMFFMSATSQNWGTCSLFQPVEINDRQVYCKVACKVLFPQARAERDKKGPLVRLQHAVEPCDPSTDVPPRPLLKGSPATLQQPQLPLAPVVLFPLYPLPSLSAPGLHCSHSQALRVPACLCACTRVGQGRAARLVLCSG